MAERDDINLEKELKDIIANVVEIDPAKIGMESNFVEDLGMDSMMALEIMAAIEKRYKIQIPEDKLTQLSNLKEALALTKTYLSKL
jgi:acyl carrier protein